MLAGYKRKTNVGVGLGMVLSIAGRLLRIQDHYPLGLLFLLAGFAVFIWGCIQYCRGKGQSPWLGLFGILSIFGLIVLFFLRDHHKENAAVTGVGSPGEIEKPQEAIAAPVMSAGPGPKCAMGDRSCRAATPGKSEHARPGRLAPSRRQRRREHRRPVSGLREQANSAGSPRRRQPLRHRPG